MDRNPGPGQGMDRLLAQVEHNAGTEAQSPWARVSVVTVTHHSAAVIGRCLAALGEGAEIIVVDNASADDTRDIVRRTRPEARLLHNPVGLGYGNGLNCGLRLAGREFVLAMNPDAFFKGDALARLLAAADRYPDAAAFAPTFLDGEGRIVRSHDVGLFERDKFAWGPSYPEPDGDLCADYLAGAVLLIRRAVLESIGFFDPNIFLYYEDDDLCYRIKQTGRSLVLVAGAYVEHIGGGSGRASRQAQWEKHWHMAWSRLYIERKYHGTAAMLSLGLPRLVRYGLKSLGYLLVGNGEKLRRDAARLGGTAAYLVGRPAVPRAGTAP
jgi:N-acetylglucosaminyl-diphospho-decaprenol L-rhamnosyltransferase